MDPRTPERVEPKTSQNPPTSELSNLTPIRLLLARSSSPERGGDLSTAVQPAGGGGALPCSDPGLPLFPWGWSHLQSLCNSPC